MKITKSQLRRIIREEVATVDKEAIEDVVMDILSDEGGAAGLDPIEDALEDLEDEERGEEVSSEQRSQSIDEEGRTGVDDGGQTEGIARGDEREKTVKTFRDF